VCHTPSTLLFLGWCTVHCTVCCLLPPIACHGKVELFLTSYFVIVLTLLVLLYWKNYHHSFLYWFILPVKKFTVFHPASCTKLLRCRKWRTGCRSLTCRIAVKMFVLQKRVMRRRPSLAAVDLRLQINPALLTCLPRGVWTIDLLPTLLWPSHLWSAGTWLRVSTAPCSYFTLCLNGTTQMISI